MTSEFRANQPDHLYVYLTSLCNHNCAFCASDHIYSGIERTVSLGIFKHFIDTYGEQARCLTISGGEPTCVGDLPLYVQAAKQKQIDIVIQTNGIELADRFYCENLIASGVSTFSVPYFASNSDSYSHLTGSLPISFSRYLRGLELLTRHAREGDVNLSLKILGLAGNMDELLQLRQVLTNHDIYPSSLCLNGLHYGLRLKNRPELIPSLNELGGVYSAIIEDFKDELPINCVEVPLCILTDSALLKYLQQVNYRRVSQSVMMLDLYGEAGVIEEDNYKPETCSHCSVADFCDGFSGKNRQMIDKDIIKSLIPIQFL